MTGQKGERTEGEEDIRPIVVRNMDRPSEAERGVRLLKGPSDGYPAEAWLLDYWSVGPDLVVSRGEARCLLPAGYERAYAASGEPQPEGPIYKVRAWGIAFYTSFLKGCPEYLWERERLCGDDRGRQAGFNIDATHWDLPGYYVIASEQHPLRAFSPTGREYFYNCWCSAELAVEQVKAASGRPRCPGCGEAGG